MENKYKITDEDFKCRLEEGYFKTPNEIFDKAFKVIATKKKCIKDFYGKGKHKYTSVREERYLQGLEIVVYVYLSRCANREQKAYPSYSTIARHCKISERKAKEIIAVLTENNFIKKKQRTMLTDDGNREFTNNLYYINVNLWKLAEK